MRSPAPAWPRLLLSLVVLLPACAGSDTVEGDHGIAAPETTPGPSEGTAAPDAGAARSPSFLLALAANEDGATGAVFDGHTWKVHAFPGEAAAWPSPHAAVAPDGTGLVVKGTGYDKPLRFARWLGGDRWTDFAEVPGSAIQGEPGNRDHGAPLSVAYRNGVFVLAYNTTGYTPVYRTFDPRTQTFGPVVELHSGAQECSTHEGEPRDCASGGSMRLRPSANGPDEVFLSLGELGGYGASFKPQASGQAPRVSRILKDFGNDVWDSAPMIPEGETTAVQMHFSFTDRFAEQLGSFGGGTPIGAAAGCMGYFKVMPRPASSDVAILCKGPRWSYQTKSWEWVMNGHLAGGELTFAKPVETTLPALTEFDFLPGIGKDASYVVGVTGDGQVALFRDLDGTPEPFAKGTTVGAAASP